MSELKTKKSQANVLDFINKIENATKKQDCLRLIDIFTESTKESPLMWGDSIIGFGSYHYKSEKSKQEGDWPLTGFSQRKQYIAIYIMPGFNKYKKELEILGKYKTSISCLYIKKLSDINIDILSKIVTDSSEVMRNNGSI